MDSLLLTVAVNGLIRFACYYYFICQFTLLPEALTGFGCFPLDHPTHRQKYFVQAGNTTITS